MGKATALCDFLHQGVNYHKGKGVELDGKQLNALSAAGLVELAKEPESKKAAEPGKGTQKEPAPPEKAKTEKDASPPPTVKTEKK